MSNVHSRPIPLQADDLKTVNGTSLIGDGDIVIPAGEQGEQGIQGETGETGAAGPNTVTTSTTTNLTGLLEGNGTSIVARALGVSASTSVPTRADADARYAGKLDPVWVQVAISPNKTAFAAGLSIGHFDSPVNGNITAFIVRCDPAQKPSSVAVECDLNKVNSSTGTRTTVLSSVATISTGTREGTGTVLTNGTEAVALGQRIVIDGDQGSDGMDYIAHIQITPTS